MANSSKDYSLLDRFLRLFSDVRPGESVTVVVGLVNLFLILLSYYIIKTVREPLVLATGGAQVKSYAAGLQALVLMFAVPYYGKLAAKIDRDRLSMSITIFFFVCIQLFFVGALMEVPYLGVIFFVWVGIFSLAVIAQFWAYENDIYTKEEGDRLFPIVAIGMTGGAFAGSGVAAVLFDQGFSPPTLMQIAGVLLLVSFILYRVMAKRPEAQRGSAARERLQKGGGFALVAASPYLRLIALLMVLLNLANTTGEYILGDAVLSQADHALKAALAADPTIDPSAFKNSFIGSFYGQFFFAVNVIGLVIQAFLVSRIMRYIGMAGVLFLLPLVSLGAYSLVTVGVGFVALRWAKTAENATDYSVMNTARQLLWLPTSRDEKYKAKQAIDTFFVRIGDLVSAGVVFVGVEWLSLSRRAFAGVNVVIVVIWVVVAVLLFREYRAITAKKAEEAAAVPAT